MVAFHGSVGIMGPAAMQVMPVRAMKGVQIRPSVVCIGIFTHSVLVIEGVFRTGLNDGIARGVEVAPLICNQVVL